MAAFQYVVRRVPPDSPLGISLFVGAERVRVRAVMPEGLVAKKNERLGLEAVVTASALAFLKLSGGDIVECVNGRRDVSGILEQLQTSELIHMAVRRPQAPLLEAPQASQQQPPVRALPLQALPQAQPPPAQQQPQAAAPPEEDARQNAAVSAMDAAVSAMVASGGLLVASLPYTGLGEPEDLGYLSVQMGALVKILPGTETAGGEGNRYPSYAFGELLGEGIRELPGEGIQRGWIPLAVLAEEH